MSIFPRRLGRGQTVTLHLRLAPSEPCFPALHLRIVDPHGRVVFEHREQQPSWTPQPRSIVASPSPTLVGPGLYEAPPLWFAGQYLTPQGGDPATLMSMLGEMAQSRHWYLHWHAPQDAVLGRYHLLVSAWVGGRESPSPTRSEDHFFVESLALEKFETRSGRADPEIHNPSAEPVVGQLHEMHRDAAAEPGHTVTARVRRVELDAASKTSLCLETDRGLLTYADGACRLWLNREQEPPWVRNQMHAWMWSSEQQVVVTSRVNGNSFTLQGPALRVWLAADGYALGSELARLGPAAFDALRERDLVVPLGQCSH